MPNLLRFSEAASLGFHATVYMARHNDRPCAVIEISRVLNCSQAHLSKVMQRLSKAGMLTSTRGPRGGFQLKKGPETTKLIDVYEVIEGPLSGKQCLLGAPVCETSTCVMGDLLTNLNGQARDYMAKTTLADLAHVFNAR